jgi:hypothetical protein
VPPFRARHTPLELLDIVRAVSLCAAPDAPTTVSGRAWDEHRAAAGHPDTPRAFSIARRLELAWSDVLRAAHEPEANRWRTLAHLQADKGRKGLTLDGVFVALRQAAQRLGQPSVNRSDYIRARELMLAASRRTRHAAVAERAMPELTQIEELLRRNQLSWEQGLLRAGLGHATRVDQRGLQLEDAVRAFIDEHAKLPRNFDQLRACAASHGIAIQQTRTPGAATQAAIHAVVEQRRQAGLPELERAERTQRFEPAEAVTTIGPPARRPRWNRESIIDGMAAAVQVLGPGQQLDQRSLKRLAAERRDLPIPSYSVVNRHLRHHPGETWEQWRREAEELARSRSSRRLPEP